MKYLMMLFVLFSLTACGDSTSSDTQPDKQSAEMTNLASELSQTGLPLEMPLMPGTEILNPIKARSGGKIHETIFKVKATPDEVMAFYKQQMLGRGYTIGEEYSDDMGLSGWGQDGDVLFSMKGSTNKRDTPEAQKLANGETRVLTIGKFKNME